MIERAREILLNLEANELDVTGRPKFARHLPCEQERAATFVVQVANDAVIDELREIDAEEISPDEALGILRRMKERLV